MHISSNKVIMATKIKPYICPNCNKDTLFFITKRNMMIDYKQMVDKGYSSTQIKDVLRQNNAMYIKCISCNKNYIIDWSNGYWGIPMMNANELEKFYK